MITTNIISLISFCFVLFLNILIMNDILGNKIKKYYSYFIYLNSINLILILFSFFLILSLPFTYFDINLTNIVDLNSIFDFSDFFSFILIGI